MFASGTKGLPEGAMLTDRSMLTEIDIIFEMFSRQDLAALLNGFPMFHHSGIAAPVTFLLSGGKLVLQPRFDPRIALRLSCRSSGAVKSVSSGATDRPS